MGKMTLLQFGSSHSSSWKLVSHLPRELPLLVAMEIAANGHVPKPGLRLVMAPLGCRGNLVTVLAHPCPFLQCGGGAWGARARPSAQASGVAGLYHVGEGGIYPHTSGNREVRGWGEGLGGSEVDGRGPGGREGLRLRPLGGGERGSPAGGTWGTQPGLGPGSVQYGLL